MMRSSDYTRLKQRENKLWEFGGIAIPGGLSLSRAVVAAVVLVVTAGLSLLLSQLLGVPWLLLIGTGVGLVAALVAYAVAGRHSPDRMTLAQRSSVLADYMFAQPRRISGFSRDAEPDTIHWRAIVWEPTSDAWIETHHTIARHLVRRWFAAEGRHEHP